MNFINKWKDKIAHYVDVRVQLMKLNLIERSSSVLSYLIFVFICLFISVLASIFLGIVIGEVFTNLLDSRPLGYLVTTGIFMLLVVIMFAVRKSIINTFSGVFIRIMTSVDEDDEDDEERDATKAD